MAEYNIGDKVMLKDDGQIYTVINHRVEDRIVVYDLIKGDDRACVKLTVLPSQVEIQKIYKPKLPQVVIYKKTGTH